MFALCIGEAFKPKKLSREAGGITIGSLGAFGILALYQRMDERPVDIVEDDFSRVVRLEH